MDTQHIERMEHLLGREISMEEKERFQRIQSTLNIANNDALWDIIIAMEYQRAFYEVLPQKIENSSAILLKNIALAVQQSNIHDITVSTQKEKQLWLLWGTIVFILLLLYGSFMLWVGHALGEGGNMQTLHTILRIPVGIVLAGICVCSGIYAGVYATKTFAGGNDIWKKYISIAIPCVALGAYILSISI